MCAKAGVGGVRFIAGVQVKKSGAPATAKQEAGALRLAMPYRVRLVARWRPSTGYQTSTLNCLCSVVGSTLEHSVFV